MSSDKRRKNSAYLHFSLFIDTHYNRRSFPSGFLVQLMTPQPFFHFLWVVARSRPLHDLCRRVARRKPVSIASPERPWTKGKHGKKTRFKATKYRLPVYLRLYSSGYWFEAAWGQPSWSLRPSKNNFWKVRTPKKKKLPFGLKRPQRLFPVTIFMMNYLYLILKKVGSFFSVGVK